MCTFFALPIRAALDFKIFSNAALRVKSLRRNQLNVVFPNIIVILPSEMLWIHPIVDVLVQDMSLLSAREGLGSNSDPSNQTHSPTTRRRYDVSVLPRRYAEEMGSATRYTLWRNTATIMKI